MICYLFPEPTYFFFSSDVPAILYYAQIPGAIIALLISFYVFWHGKQFLLNRLLLIISFLFSIWILATLIAWTNIHSDFIIFVWSFFSLILGSISVFCVYFAYVFLKKADVSAKMKIVFLALLSPIFILAPTSYNLTGFNLANCGSFNFEWFPFKLYGTLLGVLATIWILVLVIRHYRVATSNFKKQIVLMGVGIELFLFSFFGMEFLGTYLTKIGVVQDSQFELYGLFGMVIFMIFISILIVRFKAFNVKLLATQALVWGLVILIGSQFFFIKSRINMVLTGITLAVTAIIGWLLVRSVKAEDERKEQLQLISDKLASANDQLRKLDNAKSEFISIASHQLRTPLTAIKGFISLILEGSYGKVSPKLNDILNKVYISNERLIDLVEDLLNLSRIESGRMEYNFEKVDLGAICQEVYDTFIIRAKDRELSLDLVLDENSNSEAVVDKNKIREVISNLVDNALKYTKKGGVKINLLEEGENVKIAIVDTGIGVPATEIPYLFSKFSRGKDIGRLNTGGTGLGLHVGKKMIEALGGRIWVESKGANQGSTFFIEIPKEHKE